VRVRNEGDVKVLLSDVLTVQVKNQGDVKVPNATLTVTWPHALKDVSSGDSGKHVLYLMHEPVLVSVSDLILILSYALLNIETYASSSSSSSSSPCGLSSAGRCRSYERAPGLTILRLMIGGCQTNVE